MASMMLSLNWLFFELWDILRLCSCRVWDMPSWIYSILSIIINWMVQGSSDLRPPTLRVHCGDCGATLPRCRWHRQPGHPTGAVLGCRGGEAGSPVGFPTEAGSLGSPTTSMPAISIARRPAILHRWGRGWGYGWIFLWCSTSDFSFVAYLVPHFYTL